MGAQEQGADAVAGRWLTIPRTLSFVVYEEAVLLMKRAPHKRVFPNRYNGLGGHLEQGEDVMTGAIREIQEESGLDVQRVKLCGVSHIDVGVETGILLFIFRAEALSRDFQNSSEGTLTWVKQADVLSLDLVEDLPVLLPRVLAMGEEDAPFFLHFSYDEADEPLLVFAAPR